MSVLEVQKFLESRSFGELAKEWGVYARCSNDGLKLSVNYDQLEYTPGHYPTEQCRGIVLLAESPVPHNNGKPDENHILGKTSLLAYPFDKFYNEEQEQYAAKLDWSDPNLRIEDKMDGTLCILYWDHIKGKFCVSTRSVPDADLPVDGWPHLTFATLFFNAIVETFGTNYSEVIRELPKSITYLFELTTQYNRIFVNYGHKSRVTLIGARDMFTLREWNPDDLNRGLKHKFPRPESWKLTSPTDVRDFVNGRKPEDCEGAVIVDSNFNRIKIKNINWCVANATKTSLGTSPRNLMRYVLSGISDDITAMLPDDLKQKLFDMEVGVKYLIHETDSNFAQWKSQAGNDRKHFAELVNIHAKWAAPYFKMYEGRFTSSGDFLRDLVVREKLGEAMIDQLIKLSTTT